jgi:Asp-tRNA(Asn)/Glu-tRNA(Gln) amidotransferase A subunit family amidase
VADLDQPITAAGHEVVGGLLRLTFPFNIGGQPAMTVPCGFSSGGLPMGLQIAARRYDEATVLRLGHAYQRDSDWHLRQPVS